LPFKKLYKVSGKCVNKAACPKTKCVAKQRHLKKNSFEFYYLFELTSLGLSISKAIQTTSLPSILIE